jgi:predicted glutamine amidotransferase
MIQTILILLLLHYIGLYIFKPKHNTLNCGLFGWSGKDVKKFNKDKFDKLGILNVERGKSSCGIAFDGDIQIGIDSEKLYYDFIVEREIKPERFPVVIGHTRQNSVGLTNVFNAHPFGFDDNNGDYIFIGAHNGTLKNYKDLAKQYEIDETIESHHYDKDGKETVVKRDKIDSEILLEIIYKHKNFKVLSEYIGGAALVFTDTTNPNILYLFKGKSKDYKSSAYELTERPLFVYVENKNSMYFSSLEDSLKTIGGNDDNIIDIDPNTVYKITNGDFKNAEKISVTRINAAQNPSYSSSKSYGPNYSVFDEEDWIMNGNRSAFNVKKEKEEEKSTKIITLPAATTVKEKEKEKKDFNIYEDETLKPINDYYGRPYFNKLRWWRNGQLLTGIHVWINNYGYYPIGSTTKTANDRFWLYTDKVFDGKEFIMDESITGIIPFESSRIIEPPLFYFVEGVQVKTAIDYSHFYHKYTMMQDRTKYLDYIQLSQISTHPVINLNFSKKDNSLQNIVKNGIIVESLTCTLIGADKIYTIKKGNLVDTTTNLYFANFKEDFYNIEKEDDNMIDIKDYVNIKLDKESEILEQNDDELLENLVAKEKENNQIIRDLCEEDFTEPIKDFQQIRTKLFNNFSDNSLAIKVISFVDNAMKDMKEFIN